MCISLQSCRGSWLQFIASDYHSMGSSQNPNRIVPAYLQQQFQKTYLECIVIPNSRWLNILDKDCTKTADELEQMISKDRKLFIEVSHLFLLTLPMCVLKAGQVFCKNTPQGSQENLLRSFKDLELSKKFPFLVGSCPGWDAAFSDVIRFQCNCLVFWSRCACEYALLLGLYLKIDDGGIVCGSHNTSVSLCSINSIFYQSVWPSELIADN